MSNNFLKISLYYKRYKNFDLFYIGNTQIKDFANIKFIKELDYKDFDLLVKFLLNPGFNSRRFSYKLIEYSIKAQDMRSFPIILDIKHNKNFQKNSSLDSYITSYYPQYFSKKTVYYKLLIHFLGDYFESSFDLDLSHSASLLYKDKGILIFGERRSGKSTLCRYLYDKRDIVINDDDKTSFYLKKNIPYFFFAPSDIFYRKNKYLDKKEKILNHKGFEIFKDWESKGNFFQKTDFIFFINSHIKGKTKFTKIASSDFKDINFHTFSNFPYKFNIDNLPLIKIDLGTDLHNFYSNLKSIINKI